MDVLIHRFLSTFRFLFSGGLQRRAAAVGRCVLPVDGYQMGRDFVGRKEVLNTGYVPPTSTSTGTAVRNLIYMNIFRSRMIDHLLRFLLLAHWQLPIRHPTDDASSMKL